MAERKQLTLLFQYSDNWIGGTYYILNIIKALNGLNSAEKPFLRILYNSEESINLIAELNYPFLEFSYFSPKLNFGQRILNRISRELFSRDLVRKKIKIDGILNLYPINLTIDTSNIRGFYFWIPDFQDRYLPEFFEKKEIKNRRIAQNYVVKNKYPIVFSSNCALADFNKFYPNNTNRKEVLRFVSVVDDSYESLDLMALKKKFNIDGSYFIVPNQFWKHKNHKVIIEAVKVLKEKDYNISIVFTGKEFDYRNPEYTSDLKRTIAEYGLQENFRFLGFIDRHEQLQLMKNSIAIVQPSLFEGWSTVVEDTKALNHVILLSDIPLHREQMKDNCLFFKPLDHNDLASKLLYAMDCNLVTAKFDVQMEQLHFAQKIVSIL
ncbi:MAG: glycosyltransferase [Weeksellaceae bacterium]|nr:glycosyltransferase [Weeksellaceae bacterium]